MATVTRQQVESWLRMVGFRLQPGGPTSHRVFKRAVDGFGTLTISVPGHGPNDLSPNVYAMIRRQLLRAGFGQQDVAQIKEM